MADVPSSAFLPAASRARHAAATAFTFIFSGFFLHPLFGGVDCGLLLSV